MKGLINCADAQAYLGLRCPHMRKEGFSPRAVRPLQVWVWDDRSRLQNMICSFICLEKKHEISFWYHILKVAVYRSELQTLLGERINIMSCCSRNNTYILTFTTQLANSADDKLILCIICPKKQAMRLHANCSLFSWKSKKLFQIFVCWNWNFFTRHAKH